MTKKENGMQTHYIMESVNSTHTQDDQYISILEAYEISFEMAAKSALGAAVCPEDSLRGWKGAMAHPDCDEWIDAAQVKIVLANGTWELVELPRSKHVCMGH